METRVLDSIVNLTSIRDSDTLVFSLLVTLSELVKCSQVRLYYCELKDGQCQASIVLSMSLDINSNQLTCEPQQTVSNLPPTLVKAVLGGVPVEQTTANGLDYWQSIKVREGEYACLHLVCEKLSQTHRPIVDAFLRIYVNYAIVLEQSEKDKLTGLLNRTSMERKLSGLLQIQEESVTADVTVHTDKRNHANTDKAWLAVLDIDHFKQVNDTYGHLCGDEVLLTLSQIMKQFFRQNDLLFRYGGEEFVIVLEPIPEHAAYKKLDAFRKSVAESRFPMVSNVTISIGFTQANKIDFFQTIVGRADKALYHAKAQGRNRVEHYETLVDLGVFGEQQEAGSVDLF